jgi:dolichol kinase
VNGALKAAWALTALVAVAGVVLWLATGKAVFAVFLVLALLTAAGAWATGRGVPRDNSVPRENSVPQDNSVPKENNAS